MKKSLYLLLSFISLNTYANSNCGGQFDPATGTCRFMDSSGREILYNSAPPQSGRRTSHHTTIQNITVNLPSKYGAVAESLKTGAISSSFNENSKAEATKVAVSRCERIKGNGKCKAFGWIRNGCISIAEGRQGKRFKIFYAGENKNQAESTALKKCTKSGAKGCKILMPEECSLPQIPR